MFDPYNIENENQFSWILLQEVISEKGLTMLKEAIETRFDVYETLCPQQMLVHKGGLIEEFRIIGFYLYHVTLIRPSNSRGASGSLTASLNIDYDRGSSSYYC